MFATETVSMGIPCFRVYFLVLSYLQWTIAAHPRGCSTRETTDGKCCVFPFIYFGETYSGCTRKDHNRAWCSLTSNYDIDKKWGNCKGCSLRETTDGKCCVFPFIYFGETYSGCTNKDHTRAWCSLTSNYDIDRKWGNCKGCSTRETTDGKCCVFPFIYFGETYSGCAKKDHTRAWCSLTSNYDIDKKWGNCKGCSTRETTDGKCCVFPFIYFGETYSGCTEKDHTRAWCSLTSNYDIDKKWGNCKGCSTRETIDGKCCVFPFIYLGRTYSGCTKKDHTHTWCSLTSNYDIDKEWGNCKECHSDCGRKYGTGRCLASGRCLCWWGWTGPNSSYIESGPNKNRIKVIPGESPNTIPTNVRTAGSSGKRTSQADFCEWECNYGQHQRNPLCTDKERYKPC